MILTIIHNIIIYYIKKNSKWLITDTLLIVISIILLNTRSEI